MSLGLVVAIFVAVLPHVADLSEVWRTIGAMTWLELVTLLGAAVWNLVTYWVLLVVALPGLSLWQAMIVTQSSTAIANTLPGGPAFGLGLAYRMYASWGLPRGRIALALVVSGVGDLFAKLGMPIMAVAILAVGGDADPALVTASVIGVVVLVAAVALFVAALSDERSARRIGWGLARLASFSLRIVARPPVSDWGEATARFRAETTQLLRGRWPLVIGASLLSHFSLYFVLLLALRHVGVSEADVGWAEVLGGFAFVRLLSALPLTPGGLGVVELGLSAALVVAGGAREPVVAAVLLYRALTYLLQIPLGAAAYLWWRHSRTSASSEHPQGPRAGARREDVGRASGS
ncbi:hypothetical protein BH24ACT26_BH24ACT26_01430 [soil metagenome]